MKNVWGRAGVAACLAVVLTACYAAAPAHKPPVQAQRGVRAAQPVALQTYVNPVIDQNFPDPSVLRDGDFFYAYATNSGPNMLCARSPDLVHWTVLPDAMPNLPPWASAGLTWAPTVRAIQPGKSYVAYITAHDKAANTQAIGVVTSASPTGPFASTATAPLVSQPDLGGCIDASSFVDDDGSRYLIWKNDGNSRGKDTWLWLQKLSSDGLTLLKTPTQLIKQDQGWEGSLVEAPTLWKHGGKYYLFYSANGYGGCDYAIGYAVASSLRGPYVKPRTTPWQASTSGVCGPGGEDILALPNGQTWMVYHEWEKNRAYRSTDMDPLVWDGDVPYLLGPSRWPQPVPVVGTRKKTP